MINFSSKGKFRLYLSYILLLMPILLTSCSANHSAEHDVVKNLPTDPTAGSKPLSIDREQNLVTAGDPRYAPVRDVSPKSIEVPTGSLFNEKLYSGLFLQKKSFHIGDMIQVVLEEQTNASKRQVLDKDKSSELDLAPLELNAGFLKVNRGDVSLEHQQSSSFNSSSNVSQSNSLEGVVNVFVNDILENGNLVVAGEKWLKLNEGDEYVRVYGEVRAHDITAGNTISSTMIGNARIEYSGSGELQDNQNDSVIGRILSIFN